LSEKVLTPFTAEVIRWIKKIPNGKVSTYGQIAKLAGSPNASRGVVWILNSCSKTHSLPWHRVLNSQGKIAFPLGSKNHLQQKKLLSNEGVLFSLNGHADLKKFQWKKKSALQSSASNKPRLFS